MTVTVIRNAAWLVAWDRQAQRHVYLRDADLAFEGDTIRFVGRGYDGPADEAIDGRERLVMPGLVDIHCHPTNQPITRGVREELGNPNLYMSGLYDRMGLWRADEDGLLAGALVAYSELLKSGVTTTIDYAFRIPPGWVEGMAGSGMRVYAAPAFKDADWQVVDETRLEYSWDEAAGRDQWRRALALIAEAQRHACGRLGGAVTPGQIDTCTEATLKDSHAHACAHGLMWQTHACQSAVEFQEMTRRHGITPVQWLHRLGVLGPNTTLGHCIFIDAHSWTNWHTREDLRILAETGATVAHCPVVFSRYGHTLESFGGYRRAGVHVGLGTDTAPHNMLEEMRAALVCARIAGRHVYDTTTGEVFHAATVGGARAFGRDDIGRLAPGAKADLVSVDATHPLMRPCRDPLRSLVYTAADRAVRDVYVGGEQVVADGRVLTIDLDAALARLDAAQARAEANVPRLDPKGRTGMEISPPVLPLGG